MEFSTMLSQNGKVLLLHKDYKYYHHRVNKRGTEVWRCIQKKCPCKLIRVGEDGPIDCEKSILDKHNHEPEKNVNRQKISNILKRKLEISEEIRTQRPLTLIKNELMNFEDDVSVSTEDVARIQKNIYNAKKSHLTPIPTILMEVYLILSFNILYR